MHNRIRKGSLVALNPVRVAHIASFRELAAPGKEWKVSGVIGGKGRYRVKLENAPAGFSLPLDFFVSIPQKKGKAKTEAVRKMVRDLTATRETGVETVAA